MTTPTPHSWHIDDISLRAYADGNLQPVSSASVEAHLLVCAECRETFGPLMATQPLEYAWDAIRATVEAPRHGVFERILTRLGVPAESARLLVAVPAFSGAWLLGLLVVTLFAGVAAIFTGEAGLATFLLIAPLAPVAGVAACFGGDADPAHELVTVTPLSALRLLLLRTAGVLATSVPVMALVGFALPGPSWLAVAWLTPAVAGVTITLALAPSIGATAGAAAFGVFWAGAIATATRLRDPLEVVEPAMQVTLVALALCATATLLVRFQSYDHLGRHS